MPPPERGYLRQTAVLWPAAGVDDYGETLRGDPEELRCRWTVRRTGSGGSQDNAVSLDATAVVTRFVEPGSLLWLGTLGDLPGTSFTEEDNELMEVVSCSDVPDLKGRVRAYRAGLRRYKGSLPGEG